MVYIDATDETIDGIVKRICAPLFCNDRFLFDGHDESTTSATVTFISSESHVYAVTCHHVLSAFYTVAVKTGRHLVPSIHSGRSINQLGFAGPNGQYRWSFQSCREFPDAREVNDPMAMAALDRKNADKPDIAIADFTEIWPAFSQIRGADAIDLDSWREPEWQTTQNVWMAYGFPDDHKYRKGDKVAAPMPRVSAELASAPSSEKPTYMLCSTLNANHGWGFSGLSGGPVFVAHTDDRYAFVGITFEGAPSSKVLQENAEAFVGKKDILLMGYHVTPLLFREWLGQRRYGVEFTEPS